MVQWGVWIVAAAAVVAAAVAFAIAFQIAPAALGLIEHHHL
jgi:hypothetical protein